MVKGDKGTCFSPWLVKSVLGLVAHLLPKGTFFLMREWRAARSCRRVRAFDSMSGRVCGREISKLPREWEQVPLSPFSITLQSLHNHNRATPPFDCETSTEETSSMREKSDILVSPATETDRKKSGRRRAE
ncbi:hypothetical protein Nepgr_024496 [Nepenthes gracilis]|uniref:Uncharacterized protein n=1 Tax=Nepenthes gracilis TaxID=150966 RepID=A0AAD3T2Y2_NEPGR|nr:hypothetical protein Nepgr_024496 [Nepenthes gracilis]